MGDFLTDLGGALLDVIAPLEDAVSSPEQFGALLLRHGWQPPSAVRYLTQISALLDINTLEQDVEAAASLFESLSRSGSPSTSQLADALEKVSGILQRIQAVVGKPPPSGITLVSPFDDPLFQATFPRELVEDLLVRYLESNLPMVAAPLLLLGVIDEVEVAASSNPPRFAHRRDAIDWDVLPKLFKDPRAQLATTYGWGGTFLHDKLLDRLERAALAFGIAASRHPAVHALVSSYYAASNPNRASLHELRVPLLKSWDVASGFLEFGLVAFPIPAKSAQLPAASDAPAGLLVGPYGEGNLQTSFGIGGPFLVELLGGFDLTAPVGIELRPDGVGTNINPSGTYSLGAELKAVPAKPWLPIGSRDSSHLAVSDVRLTLKLVGDVASKDSPEVVARLGTTKVEVVVDFGEGDSFLTRFLGSDPQTFTFAGALVWSSKTGFSAEGKAGFTIVLAVHQTLGPVEIDSITAELLASADAKTSSTGKVVATGEVSLIVGVSGSLSIGPLTASVDNVGVRVTLEPLPRVLADGVTPAPAGTFGYLEPRFGFKPPNGLGLAVDASAVSGGGFLSYNAQKQEYAGVLDLEFVDRFSIKAIALLTTGNNSYSLAALIFVEDFTPIQLGLGFSLIGLGGTIGINRRIAVEAFRALFKGSLLGDLLFPTHPIRDAPRIISDLEQVYPQAEGRFVFGPMAKISWGTPTIVTIDLAIILELPDPVRVILLGRLDCLLPDAKQKKPLIELHMDALGVIEFGRKEASLDATLHDSRVAEFALAGDMALRMRWGDQPTFALAIGGFHPRFMPPVGFPKLRRVSISLSEREDVKFRLETYLALTSNTVQVGAHIDLHIRSGSFGLDGFLGFDALFHFEPFAFVVDMAGGLALSYGRGGSPFMTVSLALSLSGPSPWHGHGVATFSLLGFGASVSVDVVVGHADPASLPPPPDVRGLLSTALQDPRSWTAQMPTSDHMLVTLRQVQATPGTVLAHPLGELAVHQRVVPLGIKIERFGTATLTNPEIFDIDRSSIRINGQAPSIKIDGVDDYFAIAQFRELSDDEKLSRPSFESYPAGIRFRLDQVQFTGAVRRPVIYDEVVVDPANQVRTTQTAPMTPDAFSARTPTSAAASTELDNSGPARYQAANRSVAIRDTTYVVTSTDTLSRQVIDCVNTATTYTLAKDAMHDCIAAHPELVGRLQVVARHEAID